MSPLSVQILRTIEALSVEDQQQILDFAEFIQKKRNRSTVGSDETIGFEEDCSFLEVAQAAIGAGEGPGDLSTNSDYMNGYGQ